MANTVNQPSVNPTAKLTAATIAAAAVSLSSLIVRNLFPNWYDPEVWSSMTPIIIFAVGWLVPDAPNVVVITQDTQQ